jgi:hypothetical protein
MRLIFHASRRKAASGHRNEQSLTGHRGQAIQSIKFEESSGIFRRCQSSSEFCHAVNPPESRRAFTARSLAVGACGLDNLHRS